MPKKNVGLIGCGTIGTHLALAIESRTIVNASLVGLFDVVDSNAKSLQSKLKSSPEVHPDFNSFIDSPADHNRGRLAGSCEKVWQADN
jgi:predicted dehydrogenase